MSTHQHEQYCVYVTTKGATKEALEKVRLFLIEHNWDDYEFSDDYLVVDGFESAHEADACNNAISWMSKLEPLNSSINNHEESRGYIIRSA